jgi:hypothetical protein
MAIGADDLRNPAVDQPGAGAARVRPFESEVIVEGGTDHGADRPPGPRSLAFEGGVTLVVHQHLEPPGQRP